MARSMWLRGALFGLSVALVGCPRPLLPPVAVEHHAVAPLHGRVDFGRRVQATMGEIASGATVSLIDSATGLTVATSLTDANGAFSMNFGSTFKPDTTKVYFLEAVKGLQAGGTVNRAGASAARVRTLIAFKDGGWVSIANPIPGPVTVTRATTALSAIASLRSAVVTPSSLIGKLTVGTAETVNWTRSPVAPPDYAASTADSFNPTGTNIDPQDYHHVFGLVDKAVLADQDPLFVVSFDSSTLLFARQAPVFNVTSVSPQGGVIGGTFSVFGQNFDAATQVLLGGLPGAVSVSTDRTRLTVTVPAGAYSGPLTVKNGNLSVSEHAFTVANHPTAGTLFYAWHTADAGQSHIRLIASQPNTNVIITRLNADGTVASASNALLASAGQLLDFNPNAAAGLYKVTADRPIFASYDAISYGHGSDDDIATVSGTDYYFRQPTGFTTDEIQIISSAANNNVTVTCLQNTTYNWTGTLAEGGVQRINTATNTGATAAGSFTFRVQSTHPTVTTYGCSQDNNATMVPSANGDGKLFFTANRTGGAAGAGYQLVGYENGTTVNLTDLATNTTTSHALNAGSRQFVALPVSSLVTYKAVSNKPIGMYFNDHASGYDGTQHLSADHPGGIGRTYQIVTPDRGTNNIYVISSAGGNTVTLSGGISATHALGKDAWVAAGTLAANTVLTIRATQPVAVISHTNDGEVNYTMLPLWGR